MGRDLRFGAGRVLFFARRNNMKNFISNLRERNWSLAAGHSRPGNSYGFYLRLSSIFAAVSAFCFIFARLMALFFAVAALFNSRDLFASDMKAKLNSANGSTSFQVRDSGDNVVGQIDSAGSALFISSVGARGAGLTASAITSTGSATFQNSATFQSSVTVQGGLGLTAAAVTSTGPVNASSFTATGSASTSTFSGGVTINGTGGLSVTGGIGNTYSITATSGINVQNGGVVNIGKDSLPSKVIGNQNLIMFSTAIQNSGTGLAENLTLTNHSNFSVTFNITQVPAVVFATFASSMSRTDNGWTRQEISIQIGGTDSGYCKEFRDTAETAQIGSNQFCSATAAQLIGATGNTTVQVQQMHYGNVNWKGTFFAFWMPTR